MPYKPSDSEVDLMGFVSANIFWLKWTGQWFHDHSFGSLDYWKSLFLKHAFIFVAFTFPIFGEILYLMYNHNDVAKLAESLYLFLTEIFSPVKLALFTSNKMKMLEILSNLQSEAFRPTEPEHVDIVRAAIKRARTVAFAYGTICITCVYASCLVPIGEHFEVLPTNVKYPFIDVKTSPAYEAIYTFDVLLYKPLGVIIHCGIETLPPVLMACAIAQLEILAFNLEHLDVLASRQLERHGIDAQAQTDNQKRDVMNDILRSCIQHHSYIVDFVRKVENAYTLQIGSQFLLSALIICLTGVQFISIEDPIHKPVQLLWMFAYMSAMVLAVFMVCYFGHDLIHKSELLTVASYSCPWPAMDQQLKSSLIIFRERCKRRISVRAAEFFDISLITFTNLMKWSFNAFAVMNQMK